MLLLLVRHAHAGSRDPIHWADDTLRPISDKGHTAQLRVSQYLRDCNIVPTMIFSSPWHRAMQTAEILAQTFHDQTEPAIVECPPLATTPNLRGIARAVGKQSDQATLAFVGHEPWLGQFAAALLTGSASAMELDVPKSGVIGIEASRIGRGKGTLRFFVRPSMSQSQ